MYSQLLSPEPCSCCSMTGLSYLTVDISNCFGSAWLPFDVARYSRSLYFLALYMAQVQIVVSRFHGIFLLNVQLCSLAEALGWGCGLWLEAWWGISLPPPLLLLHCHLIIVYLSYEHHCIGSYQLCIYVVFSCWKSDCYPVTLSWFYILLVQLLNDLYRQLLFVCSVAN